MNGIEGAGAAGPSGSTEKRLDKFTFWKTGCVILRKVKSLRGFFEYFS
jgi:hypothetical protein